MKFLDTNMNYESFVKEIENSMKGDSSSDVLYKRKCYNIKQYRDFPVFYKIVLVDEVNDLEESWYTDDLFSFFKKDFLYVLRW